MVIASFFIPERPWVSISIYFLVGFPKVDEMDTIMVIADKFFKYVVFMVAPSVYTSEVADSTLGSLSIW